MSRISRAMLLRRVDPCVHEPQQGIDVELRAEGRCERDAVGDEVDMTIATVIGPLGFLAVGQALQHVSMSVLFLAIAVGFSAGAIAFSAAARRGSDAREEEGDAVPAGDLAAVLPAEARAD
jgi:hypothetical protein